MTEKRPDGKNLAAQDPAPSLEEEGPEASKPPPSSQVENAEVPAPFGEPLPEGEEGEASSGEESLVPLASEELRKALEAVLFSVSEPISVRALSDLFGVSLHDIREALEELRFEYVESGRAFRLEDIAGGVQILTLSVYAPWVRRLRQKEREGRLSGAALETLAVIAYKQPITRADLEAIRGVNCGPILKTLLDRGLVKIVGRDEALGKPLLYGTTPRFLESFGLASVRDLPQPELDEKPSGTGTLAAKEPQVDSVDSGDSKNP